MSPGTGCNIENWDGVGHVFKRTKVTGLRYPRDFAMLTASGYRAGSTVAGVTFTRTYHGARPPSPASYFMQARMKPPVHELQPPVGCSRPRVAIDAVVEEGARGFLRGAATGTTGAAVVHIFGPWASAWTLV
jgi:hypothetical protein